MFWQREAVVLGCFWFLFPFFLFTLRVWPKTPLNYFHNCRRFPQSGHWLVGKPTNQPTKTNLWPFYFNSRIKIVFLHRHLQSHPRVRTRWGQTLLSSQTLLSLRSHRDPYRVTMALNGGPFYTADPWKHKVIVGYPMPVEKKIQDDTEVRRETAELSELSALLKLYRQWYKQHKPTPISMSPHSLSE